MEFIADTILRIIGVVVFAVSFACQTGCTAPSSIQFAPLATVNVQDSGNGSANGNTVTPVAQ